MTPSPPSVEPTQAARGAMAQNGRGTPTPPPPSQASRVITQQRAHQPTVGRENKVLPPLHFSADTKMIINDGFPNICLTGEGWEPLWGPEHYLSWKTDCYTDTLAFSLLMRKAPTCSWAPGLAMWLCLTVSGSQDSTPSPPPPTKDLPNPRNPNGKTKFRHGGDRIRSCANKSTFKWSPGWWVPVNNVWSLSDKQEDVWNVPQSAFYISQCAHSKQSLLKRRPRSSHYVPSRTFWRGGPGAEPAQEYSLYSQQSFLKRRPWSTLYVPSRASWRAGPGAEPAQEYSLHSQQSFLKRRSRGRACPGVLTTFPSEPSEEQAPGLSPPRSTLYVPRRAFWREGPRAEPAQYSLLAPAPVQLPSQLPGDGLQVHEVAEATPRALPAGEQNGHAGYTTPPPLPASPGPACTYPISYWRQQASLKSVTGESSAWIGWPLNQRLFKSITAFSASSSRRNWKDKAELLTSPTSITSIFNDGFKYVSRAHIGGIVREQFRNQTILY